jgi:hypothetical protein
MCQNKSFHQIMTESLWIFALLYAFRFLATGSSFHASHFIFQTLQGKCSWHMPSNPRVSTGSHMPLLATECVSHIVGEFWRKWRFPSLHQLHWGQTYALSAFSGQEVCFPILNNSFSVIFQEITGLDYKFITTDEGSTWQRVMMAFFHIPICPDN